MKRDMSNKLSFGATVLLFLVIFIGLTQFVFDMSGFRFYIEFVILLGLLIFAVISIMLIASNVNFGYVLSAFVSTIALLNLLVIYFAREMGTMLFASIVAAMTSFVVSVVNIGTERRPVQEAPVIETYGTGKAAQMRAETKKGRKKKK